MKRAAVLIAIASTLFLLASCSSMTNATIKTSMGDIKIHLFKDKTPETVKNFVELAKKGFYDGLTFHRVLPDFMIQGGDPNGDGSGGESYKGPGTTIKDELHPDLKHVRGALSMAKTSAPDSGSSQFFIVQAKDGTHWLDGEHSVFGEVYEGMEVVDAIAKVDRDDDNKPITPVKMEKVTIE